MPKSPMPVVRVIEDTVIMQDDAQGSRPNKMTLRGYITTLWASTWYYTEEQERWVATLGRQGEQKEWKSN